MKKILVFMLLMIAITAYSKTIYGEAAYTYGDDETLLQAKDKCIISAKKDALEKFATFISSETVVRNYEVEKDEIVQTAQGLLTDITIQEEKIDKAVSTIFYRISAEVDEQKILGVFEAKERIRLEALEAERKAQAERLEAERKLQAEKLEAERIAESERLKHDLEKARIEQETEKIKLSREINEKDKRFWSTQKWIGLGAFVGSAALGTYFSSQGSSYEDESDGYYDDYLKATTTASALDYYDRSVNSLKKSDDFYNYRNVTFSVSLVPLGYFFYAWYKESQY